MLIEYLRKLNKRRKYFLVFILFTGTWFGLCLRTYLMHLPFLPPPDDISCHYSCEGNALPQIDVGFDPQPPSNSIYFHETSCRGNLNSRQACAIESASRAHPEWKIYVLFSGPVPKENLNKTSLQALKQFKNVDMLRLHIRDYVKGTPLEGMVRNGALNRSWHAIAHTSDVLRMLTLFKWGGVYLDLDVVVVKPFDNLAKNWVTKEGENNISNGALSFSRDELGRILAQAAVNDLKLNFDGGKWSYNGPDMVKRIVAKLCGTNNVVDMSSRNCKGLRLYSSKIFYPVPWQDAKKYFELNSTIKEDKSVYMYHVWNKLTSNMTVNTSSFYAKIAKKYCPITYGLFGEDFGT